VLSDISLRKKAEESLIKEKERAEFYLDLLCHDMGNIHQGISGALSLMKKNTDDEEKLKLSMALAENGVMDSMELCKNVMVLSKIVSEDTILKKVQLRTLLLLSVDYIKSMFPDKKIDFDIDIGDHNVYAESILKEAFVNLIHNAVRLQTKNPWIKIETHTSGKNIQIVISDKGPGIPENMKRNLFRRFGMKGERTRTGLGLSIVKALIERYNGSISVSDRIDGDSSQGVKFVISLPSC
jgi:signal transduction histidine kinase